VLGLHSCRSASLCDIYRGSRSHMMAPRAAQSASAGWSLICYLHVHAQRRRVFDRMICCPDSIGLMNRSRKPNRNSLSTWPLPWWRLQISLAERRNRPDHADWRRISIPARAFTSVPPEMFKTGVCALRCRICRQPVSLRLFGYLTRLMRALTSPSALSQYLRPLLKKFGKLSLLPFLSVQPPAMIFYKALTHISIP
jgi:hypothetical protein